MATTLVQKNILSDTANEKYTRCKPNVNAAQMARDVPRQYQRNTEDAQLLKFPSTKNILWDHTVTGDPQTLHISYFRKPRLCISEKVLRFAQRHVESGNQQTCSCMLVGSLSIDEDGEGVLFNVERLDPVGDPNNSINHAAGDMLIPFTIQTGSKERGSTGEDYSNALQLLRQRCCSKDPVELGNFLLTKGWCSFYTKGEICVHHLEFEVVTMGTEIKALPIEPVPIVPTALSKNLSGPMSISHMQGTPKTGYLTMDHTRKLLLVLESDPKVINLPLVGIWVSGVPYVYSPYVWACCLRYLHNSAIQDRVCSPPDPFLLVLYNPTHSRPEFYECSTSTGSNKMTFDLYSGYEALQISKNSMGNNELVEVDLNLIREGNKFEMFREAVHSNANDSGLDTSRRSMSPEPVSNDDITPRLKPAPHKSKLPLMQSMVPEVSLFFGDEDTTYVPNVQHPRPVQPVSRPGIPQHSAQTPTVNGHTSSHSVPNNSNAQHKPVSVAVSNYINNAQGIRTTQSVNSGGKTLPNIPNQVNAQEPVNIYPTSTGHPTSTAHGIPQSYQSINQHGANVVQTSQNGYQHGPQVGYQHAPGVPVGSGPRPSYCSCPDCPKPPQFYNRPQSYDPRGGPAQPPRPYYSNYGPPPPRLSGNYPGYHPQPGGYSHYQGPVPASQPYPQYSQGHPQPSSMPYQGPPASQMNGFSQGTQQPFSNESIPSMPVTSRPIPVSNHPVASMKVHPTTSQGQSAQIIPNHPMPQASGGLPVRVEDKAPLQRTPSQSVEGAVSNSTEMRRSNLTSDSSARSSDDSGLSFTPEKHHSPSNPSPKSSQSPGDLKSSLGGVNWDNVPPEIYQLLINQDKQLKQLQAQIEVLTLQQAQSLNNTAESVNIKNTAPVSGEKCNIATNTSLGYVQQKEQVSACMQTSQQDVDSFQKVVDNSQSVLHHPRRGSNKDQSNSSSNGSGCDTRTPAEIRHRGRLPMNSTQRDDADLDISQGELVALMNNMHDRTIDSVQSEMIVDLPSFQSSPTWSPRSQESCNESAAFNMSPRSPISASMCEQGQDGSVSEYSDEEEDGEGEEDNTAGTDNPEYYNRLMDNIKKLLSQNTTENTTGADCGYSGDISSDPSTPVKLAKEEINLGEHLTSFFRYEQSTTKGQTDTTFIPKINYVSMFLDSDTDTSMEINAMAMKYLKDEQLTQLTKLQAKNRLLQGSKKTSDKTALLQKILKMEEDITPNVTNVGMSPNDLTFATKRYLEKHGLLEGGASSGSTSMSDATQNDSYRLRTNYSTVTSGSEDGTAQITQEILSTPVSRRNGPIDTPSSGRYSDDMFSNRATPSNDSSRTPYNDSRNSAGFNRTPKPNHVQSRFEDHRRVTPNGSNAHNSSIPQSHKASPFSQNSSPYNQEINSRDIGAKGRYVTPQVTRPPNHPNHSPPEKEATKAGSPRDAWQDIEGYGKNRDENYGRKLQQRQTGAEDSGDVCNYYDSRQHRPETIDDDRILDITRLKQLPKLL